MLSFIAKAVKVVSDTIYKFLKWVAKSFGGLTKPASHVYPAAIADSIASIYHMPTSGKDAQAPDTGSGLREEIAA